MSNDRIRVQVFVVEGPGRTSVRAQSEAKDHFLEFASSTPADFVSVALAEASRLLVGINHGETRESFIPADSKPHDLRQSIKDCCEKHLRQAAVYEAKGWTIGAVQARAIANMLQVMLDGREPVVAASDISEKTTVDVETMAKILLEHENDNGDWQPPIAYNEMPKMGKKRLREEAADWIGTHPAHWEKWMKDAVAKHLEEQSRNDVAG